MFVFQSQQARLATLYLPLFGLLQENVHRLNVKEVSPFPVNHSNNVRPPSSGPLQNLQRYVQLTRSADVSRSCFVFVGSERPGRPSPGQRSDDPAQVQHPPGQQPAQGRVWGHLWDW